MAVDTPADRVLAVISAHSLRARALAHVRRLLRTRRRVLALAAVALLGMGGGGFVWAATHGLPAFDTLKDYQPLIATRVYGSDGSEVFEFYRERRTVVPFDQIPEVLKKAVLASEDAKFYEHGGVNYLAIARCAVRGVFRGRFGCGGSTITQQVVKTFLLQNEWRVKRKLKEFVLAPRLEQNLSKDEILYLYLNQIYFGHRRYGVEEASRFYFGKSVRKLTVGEAAMIAGVVQSPERLSTVKHPQAAKERQKYVLRRMAEEGFISRQTAEVELARPILVANRSDDPPGAWYADAVRKYLDQRYSAERVETDGLEVDVAMDPALQKAAEDAVEAQLRAVDKRQGWRGAVAHLDPQQLEAAMPLWKERLKTAQAGPGEVVVWDLGRVSPDEVEAGAENQGDVRRMLSVKPLRAGRLYTGLVSKATDRAAVIDLGNATGTLAFSDVAWARKYNPVSATAVPRRMTDVMKQGDLVLVRVQPGKVGPAEPARAGADAEGAGGARRARRFHPRHPRARGRLRLRPLPVQPRPAGEAAARLRVQALRVGRGARVAPVHRGHPRLRHAGPVPGRLDGQGVETAELRARRLRWAALARAGAGALEEHRLGEARRRARRGRGHPGGAPLRHRAGAAAHALARAGRGRGDAPRARERLCDHRRARLRDAADARASGSRSQGAGARGEPAARATRGVRGPGSHLDLDHERDDERDHASRPPHPDPLPFPRRGRGGTARPSDLDLDLDLDLDRDPRPARLRARARGRLRALVDDARRGRVRHRPGGEVAGTSGGGKDWHRPGAPRRVVRRLFARAGGGRVGGLRLARPARPTRDRRRRGVAGLGGLHARGAGARRARGLPGPPERRASPHRSQDGAARGPRRGRRLRTSSWTTSDSRGRGAQRTGLALSAAFPSLT